MEAKSSNGSLYPSNKNSRTFLRTTNLVPNSLMALFSINLTKYGSLRIANAAVYNCIKKLFSTREYNKGIHEYQGKGVIGYLSHFSPFKYIAKSY